MGYTLDKVRLPEQPGVPGTLEFVVDSHRGTPQTEFLMEQTKRIHVYVVREDLSIFRHVHPTMADDGTWTSPLTLPTPGRYRVVVEFIAKDEGGNGDHVILGDAASGRDLATQTRGRSWDECHGRRCHRSDRRRP